MVVLIVFCFIISLPNVEIIHKTFCADCALDVVISRRNKLTSDRKKNNKKPPQCHSCLEMTSLSYEKLRTIKRECC